MLLAALGTAAWHAASAGELRGAAVTVAVDGAGTPLSGLDSQGHYVGMVETAVDMVGAELGWVIQYSSPPWKRAQQYIKQGTLDAFCTVPTAERLTYARFAVAPLFTLDAGWAHFVEDNPRADEIRHVTSMDELRRFRIGLRRGAAWPNDLMGTGWNTTEVESLELMDPMLRAHRIDLILEIPEIMRQMQRKAGRPQLASAHFAFLPGRLIPFTFGLRRSYENAELRMSEFGAAQSRLMASGAIDRALAPFRV